MFSPSRSGASRKGKSFSLRRRKRYSVTAMNALKLEEQHVKGLEKHILEITFGSTRRSTGAPRASNRYPRRRPPFDLFIRWKPLSEQPIGWDPDTNDGVRLNARPFMASDIPGGKKGAGLFRWKPNIQWGKDRGKEPISLRPKADFPWFWSWDEQSSDFLGSAEFDGNRWNGLHYSNKLKSRLRAVHCEQYTASYEEGEP